MCVNYEFILFISSFYYYYVYSRWTPNRNVRNPIFYLRIRLAWQALWMRSRAKPIFFYYDAQVINLSEKVRKPLSGRSVFEILNLLFKNTEIVRYTVMNDQIILNKKEAIIQMQQKLDGKVKGIVTDHKESLLLA